MKPVRFTRHAFERINGTEEIEKRLNLTEQEIADLIDSESTIPLGREKGKKDRLHLLFYSHIDELAFVAVFDDKTREVITILPIDYHNRWRISGGTIQQARELEMARINPEKKEKVKPIQAQAKFELPLEIYPDLEQVRKMQFEFRIRSLLRKTRVIKYEHTDALQVLLSPEFQQELITVIQSELSQIEEFENAVVKISKKSQWMPYPLNVPSTSLFK